MNIAVKALEAGREHVTEILGEAEMTLAAAIEAMGRLFGGGAVAAMRAGIPLGLVGEALDFAGRANADLGHAALMLQGVHASLHEALKRLAPNDEAAASGGGGKEPPPKP